MAGSENPSFRRWSIVALVSALVGIGVSIWLFIVHLSFGGMAQSCHISELVNCDILQLRTYSEWFGVPIPVFGFLFYVLAAFACVLSIRRSAEARIRPIVYLWLLSWIAIASTIYMASIAFGMLRTLCPFCAVLYAVSIVLFLSAWKMKKASVQAWGHLVRYDIRRVHRSPIAWGFALFAAAVFTGARVLTHQKASLSDVQVTIAPEDQRTLGPKVAPSVVVEFSDFECPHCRVASDVLKDFAAQAGDRAQIIYKFYPLDQSCNRMGGRHQHSCKAAIAAYCAGTQGKFWDYEKILFEHQKELSEALFLKIAQRTGLRLTAFETCLKSDVALKEVQKDIEEGITLNLEGTPALFVNGRKYSGPLTVDGLLESLSAKSD